MKTEKYNINDYLLNLSISLYDNYNNYNNENIQTLNKLRVYLSLVFQSDYKVNNLFNTLEHLLFKSINNNIYIEKKILILYPAIFGFNPKITYKYIDNFLLIFQKCLVLNENDYAFLSYIFNEFATIFIESIQIFNDKQQFYIKLLNYSINLIEYNLNNNNNNNYNIIEEEKNVENEHLLGIIFLSIIIDKFNIFNSREILNNIWNILSYYFSKKNLKYTYDILFCTLKLINNAKEQFKIYCNLCLFTILDYLIDDKAAIRKISLDIIYALTKYCKNEILTVKDNIIEFLNILKEDKNPKVKEACIQTLNSIEDKNTTNNSNNALFYSLFNKSKEENNEHVIIISELDSENEKNNSNENLDRKKYLLKNRNYSYDNNKNSEINKYENTFQPVNKTRKKIKINLSKKCPNNNINFFKYIKSKPNGNNNFSISKLSYSVLQSNNISLDNQILDKSASISNHNIKKSKINVSKAYSSAIKEKYNINLKQNLGKFGIEEYKNKKNKNSSLLSDININKIKKQSIIKDDKINKEVIKGKNILKNKNINNIKKSINNKMGHNKLKKINNKNNNTGSYFNFQKKFEKKMNDNKNNSLLYGEKKDKFINNIKKVKKVEKFKKIDSRKIKEKENNSEINPRLNLLPLFTEEKNDINKKVNNNINNNNPNDIVLLTEQLNTLYKGQNMLIKIINNLKEKVDTNYKTINERLNTYEGKKIKNKIERKKTQNNNDNNKKIELIKLKYNNCKFNDALLESIQNDIYLFKLLPLIKKEDLPKINIVLIEDIISRLSLKISSILKSNNNRKYFRIILSFFNVIVNSDIKLKLITKLNVKDSLNFIKDDYKYFNISAVDMNIIGNIIKSIN